MNEKNDKLTKKQTEIYEAIKKYIQEFGYSPTIREICEITKRNSPATIFEFLLRLEDKGYIAYKSGKSRTIRVIK